MGKTEIYKPLDHIFTNADSASSLGKHIQFVL